MTEATDNTTDTNTDSPSETLTTVWQGITLEVTYQPRWLHLRDLLGYEVVHLAVSSRAPLRAPLPITETGYRSSYPSAEAIADFGGPVAFVLAWLDEEARNPAWLAYVATTQQRTLF